MDMNLAAILGFYLLSLGCLSPGWLPLAGRGFVAQRAEQPPAVISSDSSTQQSQDSVSVSQPQAPQSQSPEATQPLPSPTSQTPNPPGPAKPPLTKPHRRHKKTSTSNCLNSPTALNPAAGNPANSTNATGSGSPNAGSANPGSVELKPCPPPKKVVRNGGSDEPTVQLTGGTAAEQAVHQRSTTDQLNAATEANLEKVKGRKLSPSQQEMKSQIKQFMEQSKTAVAAGDLERGHNLALKAHLLSDELVKP